MRQQDGNTLRDQLNVVWRNTGRKPPELESAAELPEMFYEVWGWFLKLHSKRTSNGFSANPLSYSEIKAFFALIQYQPQHWELLLIEKFDEITMQVYEEIRKKEEKKQSK
jgi:hypothetical protein